MKDKVEKDPNFFSSKVDYVLNEFLIDDKSKLGKERYYSLSSVLGAFCADSIGSYFEFSKGPNPNLYDDKMVFIQQNPKFLTLPGQFTDDSELAMSSGLALLDGNGSVNLNKIAFNMGMWLITEPFDVGITIRNSLKVIADINTYKEASPEFYEYIRCASINKEIVQYFPKIFEKEMINSSFENNRLSLSNGFLMKSTPISVFGMNLVKSSAIKENDHHIKDLPLFDKIIRQSCLLTHSHGLAVEMSVVYSLIITRIIYYKTLDTLSDHDIIDNVLKYIATHIEGLKKQCHDYIFAKFNTYDFDLNSNLLNEWKDKIEYYSDLLHQIKNNKSKKIFADSFYENMGYFGKALFLLFQYLHKLKNVGVEKMNYYEMIKEICNLGGDTDTNAAIVGGVIGIFIGAKRFKNDKKFQLFDVFLHCNTLQSKRFRPFFFSPGSSLFMIYGLYKIRERIIETRVDVTISETDLPISSALFSLILTTNSLNDIEFDV